MDIIKKNKWRAQRVNPGYPFWRFVNNIIIVARKTSIMTIVKINVLISKKFIINYYPE